MARRIDLITELYQSTAKKISDNPGNWIAFLNTGANNYKYSFDDQVLIFAQRPQANACAEIEVWNTKFQRWVNQGAKGIALIRDINGYLMLRHVFDISDTNSRYGNELRLWRMEDRFQDEVIEALEAHLGGLSEKSSLENAILSAAKNAVEDNIADYLTELLEVRIDSFLEELDELNVEQCFKTCLKNSVAYMMLTRCGIDTDGIFTIDDFRDIINFNTLDTITRFGAACSDISEMGLREIEATVKNLQFAEKKSNRTFAIPADEEYPVDDKKQERMADYHDDSLQRTGTVQSSEPYSTETGTANAGQIRGTEKVILEEPPKRSVHNSESNRKADSSSVGNRENREGTHETPDSSDGEIEGRDGADEGGRPNEMGRDNELNPALSGRNGVDGADLQLIKEKKSGGSKLPDFFDEKLIKGITAKQMSLFDFVDSSVGNAGVSELNSFFRGFGISQQVIDEALCLGGNEPNCLERVCAYFAKDYPLEQNASFLKVEYGYDGKGFYFNNHQISIWFNENGFRISEGLTTRGNRTTVLTWEDAAKRIRELLDAGRYVPQSVIDHAELNERKELVEDLWYLVQNFSEEARDAGFIPTVQEVYNSNKGFPEETQQLIELLKDPSTVEHLTRELNNFAEANEQNKDLLRFRFQQPDKLLAQFQGLQRVQLVFFAKDDLFTPAKQFISNDEIDKLLISGGSIDQSKFRIYAYFLHDHTAKERAAFLKHEYGEGGSGRLGFDESHNSQGICYSREDNLFRPYYKILLKWNKVEKRINELIQQNRYMTEKELAYIPTYEKNELARSIYHFFSGISDDAPCPFPRNFDFWDGVKCICEKLDDPVRVEEIYQMMLPILESTIQNEHNYSSRQQCFGNLTDYRVGTFSLFNKPKESDAIPSLSAEAPAENKTDIHDLAVRLNYFYKAFDHYNYRDNMELGDTDDDAISGLVTQLHDERQRFGILDTLQLFFDDTDPEEEIAVDLELFIEELQALVNDEPEAENTEAKPDTTVIEKQSAEEFQTQYLEGKTLSIDGREFRVDSIDNITGYASLMDITFKDGTGFPVFRRESIDFVREQLETEKELPAEEMPVLVPVWEHKKKNSIVPVVIYPDIKQINRNNFRITDDELGFGGVKDKFNANATAIKLLKQLESEIRLATPEEQKVLAQYVGWGGISQAFDDRNNSWSNEYLTLKNLLDEDEYAAARESTLTAFYTSPVIIRAMYKAMKNMGFVNGNILEPSCGTGNFFGLLPDSMADCKLYGVELDSITGRITQQLYQNTSIVVQGYEKIDLPDSFFDLAVGNVPFGQFKVSDKRYDKNNFLIHDYFFAKTLDKVRPGGIIAFITSKGTLDKENPAVRKYIAQRADLLGAIRLPNTAFKSNAGTEVTADIIFLQKRDRIVDIEPDWVYLGNDENGIVMNQYFIDNPDMLLGEMVMESTGYGMDSTCRPYDGADLSMLLDDAIAGIHAEIYDYETGEQAEEDDLSIPADPSVRNFSFAIVDGEIYYRENSRMNPVDVPVTASNRIRGMIELRNCVRMLIEYQTEDYPDYEIKEVQEKLNTLYDTFTKKYGLINSRANNSAFSDDSSYCLLCSLETIDENGELLRKADMFTKRTIKPHIVVTSVDTASEALAVSIAECAQVDIEFMCRLSGESAVDIEQELTGVIFRIPSADESAKPCFVTADEYLSGNVREKLNIAKLAAQSSDIYDSNVKALEAVQPTDLSASEISVRLGATWLPPEVVQEFMFHLLDTPRYCQWNIKVHYSELTGEWNIEGKSYDRGNIKAVKTYGTNRISAYKIIEETLNLRDVRIFDYVEDADGKKTAVLNKKETAIAQAKQEQIKAAFAEWIWIDPYRREKLVRLYNDKFNSIRSREYDGKHITFSGINPEILLRTHQVNAVARIMYGGNTLLAHIVGAGKTFEMVAASMESKRLSLCHKSLFIVPNHLTEQWASDFLQLYPSANILVATKKDFETKSRKKFCARIATGDYDAVIIGHSQFEKIPMSIERQRAILQQQLNEILNGIADLKANRGENFAVKQLEKTRKTLQVKLEKLNDQSRKDDVVTFEELGVDRIFVDEAHYYKNLFLYTKMRNVGGIAQTEAQKSSDLFMKCRYLDEITGGRGVIFATGTPISNSMVEMYTMQRYLQYMALQMAGLQHFDAWASTFGETVTAIELAPEGTGYRAKTRFAKFYNLPELMTMFRQVADIQTADMLNLPVPKATYHNIVIKPSELQVEMVAELSKRADRVRNKMVDAREDNMLKITNDGRKLALDQRLMNELLPDSAESKAAVCAKTVYQIWDSTRENRLTQLIFCDLSTPHGNGKFNVYDDIRGKLTAKGIPSEEVAFIHEADTETKKKELFTKVRSGQVRVLLGSTPKMGAGTNVQDKLIASHDLDCPWRPSDLEQRGGRIVRQGNQNPEVGIYRYVTEKTFDAYSYQLVENKQKFISQIMTSKSPVRSAEDIDETALSYAEIKMLATGNPYIKEKMDLDIAVLKLKVLKQSHLSQKYDLEDSILKYYPQEIKRFEERIWGYKSDIEHLVKNTSKDKDIFSSMIIRDITYSEKVDAGKAIIEECCKMVSLDAVEIGKYRGFQMELSFDTFSRVYCISLKNKLHHTVTLGSDVFGNITRLDNALDSFPEKLKACEEQLDNTRKQLENANAEVQRPFPQEDELKVKSARLDELNIMLNMDHKENEIMDGETIDEQIFNKMEICIGNR